MNSRQHDYPNHSSTELSDDVLKTMMDNSIRDAESIYKLCEEHNQLDSQLFINWQDRLNAISVAYKNL